MKKNNLIKLNYFYNKLKNHARNTRDFIIELIFPATCLNCGKEGTWLCPACARKLYFIPSQYCLHCKQENNTGRFCNRCQHYYRLDGVWIAGDYENEIMASLIKHLKYRFLKDITKILGQYLCNFLDDLFKENTLNNFSQIKKNSNNNLPPDFKDSLIIPVPLHKKRKKWRGFNQSEELAKIVASYFNLNIDAKNLIRIKNKKAQVKLSKIERWNNVKDCFKWQGKKIKKRNIILIDDVVTTGATLNECARVLKNAGAGKIWGLVLAKG